MRQRPSLVWLALVLAALAGCVSLARQVPPVHRYMLEAARPQHLEPAAAAPALAVQPLEAAPAWAGKEFVYRTGPFAYEKDFYNQFLDEPAGALTLAAQGWLADSGLFSHVTAAGTGPEAKYVLNGRLLALYGDYRRPDAPNAVLRLRFLLLEGAGPGARIVLQRDYEEAVAAGDGSPGALASAWSKALAKALQALTKDIAARLPAGP